MGRASPGAGRLPSGRCRAVFPLEAFVGRNSRRQDLFLRRRGDSETTILPCEEDRNVPTFNNKSMTVAFNELWLAFTSPNEFSTTPILVSRFPTFIHKSTTVEFNEMRLALTSPNDVSTTPTLVSSPAILVSSPPILVSSPPILVSSPPILFSSLVSDVSIRVERLRR
jgi:hypothetical protein